MSESAAAPSAPAMSGPVGIIAAPPATPAPATPPVAPSTPPPAQPDAAQQKHTIAVLPEDWASMNQELAKFRAMEAARQAEIDTKQAEAIRAQAVATGTQQQFEEYKSAQDLRFTDQRSKFENLEREVLLDKRDAVVADALASVQLVKIKGVDPAVTVAQIKALLLPEIEAVRDGAGKVKVQDKKTFRPADQWLKERLSSAEFAHFVQPTNKGGSGGNPNPERQAPGIEGTKPGSLNDIAAEYFAKQAAYSSMGLRPTAR